MPKKKKAVKDKYYRLAKEQGYRARSCFKLIQLDRKYNFLSKADRVIDLCAAPGGWLQVCQKHMKQSSETQIIGVDLLPIKPIKGCVTFQCDITTAKCRYLIKNEMKGKKADVVMCDGAPNVGAEYSKDAFVQSELVIHAVRFATDHLVKGGIFISKVFRSSDYNSLIWVMKQLFKKVEATKPASSRNVSAEIFVVCQGYLAPDRIDPKLLDPKHVFEQVEAEVNKSSAAVLDLFHKKNKPHRNREGYDASLGMTLYTTNSVSHYIASSDPIRVLAEHHALNFDLENIVDKKAFNHASTSDEIKTCLKDLKVLGKSEFRMLLKWRVGIRKLTHPEQAKPVNKDDKKTESTLEEELDSLKQDAASKVKRERKRKARERARLQHRMDLGIEQDYAFDVNDESNQAFSLKKIGIKSLSDLDDVNDVNLSAVGADQVPGEAASEWTEFDNDYSDQEEDYLDYLESQMDSYYERFQQTREKSEPLSVRQMRQQQQATRSVKLKKKQLNLMAAQSLQDALEDEEQKQYEASIGRTKPKAKAKSVKPLAERASASSDDEDASSDESDDNGKSNPLVAKLRDDSAPVASSLRASRWFSQAVFEGADEFAGDDEVADAESDAGEEQAISEADSGGEMPLMPRPFDLTDKSRRAKVRKRKSDKEAAREEKKRRLAAQDAEYFEREISTSDFVTVPEEQAQAKTRSDPDRPAAKQKELTLAQQQQQEAARLKKQKESERLIRLGMGHALAGEDKKPLEIAPLEEPRYFHPDMGANYDSDDYDSDEHAQHLAMGRLMTKPSKKRDILFAAYNRYAFNDDDLPAWFAADEAKHNRPQLPITKEMVDAIKAQYKDLAAKPMHKVAEARARKKRKAVIRLENSKKKAAAVADAPDMTARSKMRAIEKIYKGAAIKRPGTLSVVAKKSQGGRPTVKGKKGQRVKIVDKRLRADASRFRKDKDKKGKGSGKGKGKRTSKAAKAGKRRR